MPTYEYECENCGTIQEIAHSMNDSPKILCSECSSCCRRLISQVNFIIKNTNAVRKEQDTNKKQTDMKRELREKHGVHDLAPINGNSLEDVYKDIKQSGSMVKDRMQMNTEENQRKIDAKHKQIRRNFDQKKAREIAAKRRQLLEKNK